MKIQEVCDLLHLTKKAIYYYEKQGLLSISKDKNGYRIFDEFDIERLHEISLYRKLNIEIHEIKRLIQADDKEKIDILNTIYHHKKTEHELQRKELECFKKLIDQDVSLGILDEQIDYQNIAKAIQEQVPGLYGQLFIQHFLPYLQGSIQNDKQAKAYQTIINFWDHTELKLPLGIRFVAWLNRNKETSMIEAFHQSEKMKEDFLNDEDAYEKAKQLMETYYLKSQHILFKIIQYQQRQLKIQLQKVGYNDIFLPAMCELSPEYYKYSQKWQKLNTKLMQDLGMYYDHKMRLCRKE